MFFVLAILLSFGSVRSFADHPGSATSTDLRQLRAEADRLDDSLRAVASGHPRALEFRRREADIRSDLIRLEEEIRAHQRSNREGYGASKDRIDALSNDIADLRSDIDATLAADTRGARDASVADGTEIRIRLERSLSSKTARPEDRVAATVSESVRVDGRVAIPAGTEVRGIVQQVEPARRPARGGRLELAFDSLVLDDRTVNIQSRVIDVHEDKVDKSKAGLGALVGGVLGAVIDGKKGALIGAVVGGGGAVAASSGDEVELPAGTVLTLRLDRPLNVARR